MPVFALFLFNRYEHAEDRVACDPTVDVSAVVADLKLLSARGFDQMEVLVAAHFAEHDVTHLELAFTDRFDRAFLTAFDATFHAVARWSKDNCFTTLESGDVRRSPSHAAER